MKNYFTQLLRNNFRCGRMFYSRTHLLCGTICRASMPFRPVDA